MKIYLLAKILEKKNFYNISGNGKTLVAFSFGGNFHILIKTQLPTFLLERRWVGVETFFSHFQMADMFVFVSTNQRAAKFFKFAYLSRLYLCGRSLNV